MFLLYGNDVPTDVLMSTDLSSLAIDIVTAVKGKGNEEGKESFADFMARKKAAGDWQERKPIAYGKKSGSAPAEDKTEAKRDFNKVRFFKNLKLII